MPATTTSDRIRRALAPSLLVLALAACSADAEDLGDDPGTGAAGQDGAGVEVTDQSGAVVALPAPATRVVCLDGACVDALTEIGLEPVAAQPLDTVQHEYFFGPDAATSAITGSFFEPSLEDVVAAEPDLVMGSQSVHGELAGALEGVAPLYLTSWDGPEDAVETLRHAGVLTGHQDEAAAAEQRYRDVLDAYGPTPRSGTVLSMYGGATDDLGIDAADSVVGRTLAPYTSYPWPEAEEGQSGFLEFSLDGVLDVDPAAIYVLDFGFDPDAAPLVDQLTTDPLWNQLSAVRSGDVQVVDGSWWGTAQGTRGQQLVLDTVLPALYPEEFPKPLGPAS